MRISDYDDTGFYDAINLLVIFKRKAKTYVIVKKLGDWLTLPSIMCTPMIERDDLTNMLLQRYGLGAYRSESLCSFYDDSDPHYLSTETVSVWAEEDDLQTMFNMHGMTAYALEPLQALPIDYMTAELAYSLQFIPYAYSCAWFRF